MSIKVKEVIKEGKYLPCSGVDHNLMIERMVLFIGNFRIKTL